MNIAIIGLGEVGRCYAKAMHGVAGSVLGLCEAHTSAAASALANALDTTIHAAPGPWLAHTDLVLSCVTGSTTVEVLTQLLPHLPAGCLVADLTTASPEVKRQAAALASAQGLRYVDTAIMGAISLRQAQTPLLASGDGAAQLQAALALAGAPVQVIEGGQVGDAISLKMLRSIFTKGMEALCVELLMSAERQGVRSALYTQLQDIDDTPLPAFIDMLVRTHVIHAQRRAHEVHDAQSQLQAQGLSSLVLPGVAQRFEATAQALAHSGPGIAEPSVEQALDWLLSLPQASH